MKAVLIKRIKKGLPYGIIFIIVSLFLYFQDAKDLALTAFSIETIL